MGKLRAYEFDPRIVIYGFSRDEALQMIEKVLKDLCAKEPTVALAQQHPTTDKAWLKRKGIDVEGVQVGLTPGTRPPGYRSPPVWMVDQERGNRGGRI